MKKLTAISVFALALTTCSTGGAQAQIATVETQVKPTAAQVIIGEMVDRERSMKAAMIERKINKVVSQLKNRVGKTRYVFSGSSPAGWDCSGMVKWAYGELGIDLIHRASKQQNVGNATKSPKLGDIVVFKYKGHKSAYHVGIYLDEDTMIHAGNGPGDGTSIVSISKFAGNHTSVSYRNIM